MKKIKEWNKFYDDVNKDWYLQHVKAVKGFAHRVARFTPENESILEIGFGTGQISIYLDLMKKGYKCYGIDSNREQVVRAHKLAIEMNANVHFQELDAFKLKDLNYHTIFSQGLLEHFESYDIKALIKKQFENCKVVAFSVPLDKFGHKSRGDEILRSEYEWMEIITELQINESKKYEVLYWETFSQGKHLIGILKEVKE
jgi:2-polyprenyl-3-methyl-5-hydroxy-6-metoxy-1,4-benzoquinol methylase